MCEKLGILKGACLYFWNFTLYYVFSYRLTMDFQLTRCKCAEITGRTISCICQQIDINSLSRYHSQTVNQNCSNNAQTTTTSTTRCKMKKQFHHTNNELISSAYSLLLFFLLCFSVVYSNSATLNLTIEDQVAQVGHFFYYNIMSNDSILMRNFTIKVHTEYVCAFTSSHIVIVFSLTNLLILQNSCDIKTSLGLNARCKI